MKNELLRQWLNKKIKRRFYAAVSVARASIRHA
jgi:hypothetical protein